MIDLRPENNLHQVFFMVFERKLKVYFEIIGKDTQKEVQKQLSK